MVAKIGRGNHLKGVLIYNYEKVAKDKGNVLFCHKMIEPLGGGFNIPLLERSFEPYLIANKRTEKPILHISLNPHPKDNVSDKEFQQLAETYMDDMGYGNQPFVVFKHTDISRSHIHIVSVCVDETGKRIPDSFEKRRSMKVCRDLEKQFGLVPAAASEKLGTIAMPLQKVDATQASLKQQIASVLSFVNDNYHFQTIGEYKALLSFFNVTVEEIRGEVHGKPKKGLVYFATDDTGKKVSHPLKASRFSGKVGLTDLHKKTEVSKAFIQRHKPQKRLRKLVREAFLSSQAQDGFKTFLEAHKVSLFVRENTKGRIYGVSFIDHSSKTVLNGSRLGRDFSANVFHNWWKEGKIPMVVSAPEINKPSQMEQQPIEDRQAEEAHGFPNQRSWEALGGLLPMDVPPENDRYIPKKKRKKKKHAK